MTVLGTASRILYACNGATNFPLGSGFLFFDEADLVVVRVDALGNEEILTLTTDYTVNGGDGATGSIDTVATYTDGEIVIYRDMEIKQTYDAEQGDGFDTDTFERLLDRMVMLMQNIKRDVDRSIRISIVDSGIDTSLPQPQAGAGIRWSDDGSSLENFPLPFGSLVQIRQQIIATQGQTVFQLTAGAEYSPGTNNISVEVDGRRFISRITDPADGAYYETNPTTITMDEGLAAGQKVVLTVNAIDSSSGLVGTIVPETGRAVVWDGFQQRSTEADFNDVTSQANTSGKYAGKPGWPTDAVSPLPVWASGAAAGDVWIDSAGNTIYTPV